MHVSCSFLRACQLSSACVHKHTDLLSALSKELAARCGKGNLAKIIARLELSSRVPSDLGARSSKIQEVHGSAYGTPFDDCIAHGIGSHLHDMCQ
jgi:hypothetical protein